ncbi:MAG: zinc ABC transporter substrate-binding protein [Gallionella sp.]
MNRTLPLHNVGIRRLGLALLALMGLSGLGLSFPAMAAPLQVFVSILPQKYFVEHIGGKQVAVSVMVGPGQSPETYEPTPRQMVALSQARLYFSIGVPFEDTWMNRIRDANPALRVVPMQRGIALLPLARPGGEPGGTDPHVWTSPRRVETMAATIRDALIETDPAHRGDYESNYRAFIAELDALDRNIQSILAPAKGKPFLVFHPAWGYFAKDYALRQIPIEAEGKEPGAKALARVIDFGREEGVKVIFVQEQFSRRTAATVAAAIGARVVAVDPLAEDYPQNLLRVAHEFADSLK